MSCYEPPSRRPRHAWLWHVGIFICGLLLVGLFVLLTWELDGAYPTGLGGRTSVTSPR